jgi:hypothetical protein
MTNNTTGMRNTGVGLFSFYQNTTGNYNTAIGLGSLGTNTTGSYNTALGTGADVAADNLTNATAIGYGASVAASNTIQIGNAYVTKVNTSGSITAGTVSYPNTHNSTSGQVLTINSNGVSSWANPASSGVPYTGATGAVNLGAYDLTVNGLNIGRGAGNISTNTSVGSNALVSNIGGGYNTAVGIGALQVNTNGSFNTSLGTNALLYNNGDQNIAVGSAALQNNSSGNLNTALGFSSNTANTSGNENTSLGHGSLSTNTTGSSNTAIGAQSNVGVNNLSNATALGYQAIVDASNSIQLGNSNVTNVKTSGTITALGFKMPNGTSSEYLMADGSKSTSTPSASSGSWALTSIINNSNNEFSINEASGFYQKVGNVVSFSLYISLNGSGNSGYMPANFDITIPVASNFTSARDASGTVSGSNMFGDNVAGYIDATTSGKMRINLQGAHGNVDSPNISISGMYIVK